MIKMRAFIAIELPSEIRDALYTIQKQIGSRNAKIRWVAKKNLHLTLKFFPQIPSDKLEKVKEKLSEIKFKPFKVKLSDLGFFPSKDIMKVIWVGLSNHEKIMDIQGDVELSLHGLYPKGERFSTHLTLGRVKLFKNKEKFFEVLDKVKIPKLEFEISELVLLSSVLTKDGPKYSVIKRF